MFVGGERLVAITAISKQRKAGGGGGDKSTERRGGARLFGLGRGRDLYLNCAGTSGFRGRVDRDNS